MEPGPAGRRRRGPSSPRRRQFPAAVGPLEPDAAYVSQERLIDPNVSGPDGEVPGFTVDDTKALRLATLQVKVFLRSAQVDDPELTSALIAFRRGANVLAHLEDEIIFKGQPRPNEGPATLPGAKPSAATFAEVNGGETTGGLLGTYGAAPSPTSTSTPVPRFLGALLVSDVSRAVGELERRYHLGPFACVLGHTLLSGRSDTQQFSCVAPGPHPPVSGGRSLVRSSALPDDSGLLIAVGGAPIDLVLATDVSVEFLQITPDARFVFRIYEKMVLRVSQSDAIEPISV